MPDPGVAYAAQVAFIDEIFKANSAILNALLTLLNERLFDNGTERLPVPLLTLVRPARRMACVAHSRASSVLTTPSYLHAAAPPPRLHVDVPRQVGASNELPESEELDALYDRFLVRRNVSRVSNNNVHLLARLASGRLSSLAAATGSVGSSLSDGEGNTSGEEGAAPAGPGLGLEDFRNTPGLAYQAVDVPDSVIDLLVELRNWLQVREGWLREPRTAVRCGPLRSAAPGLKCECRA